MFGSPPKKELNAVQCVTCYKHIPYWNLHIQIGQSCIPILLFVQRSITKQLQNDT
jgi:hypothetical protein